MFDIGWQELFIIVVIGILVIGPKERPRAARAISGFVRKPRMMAHEFQDGVDDMIRQADIEDIKNQAGLTGEDLKKEIENTIDPDGTITRDLDTTEFEDDEDEDEEFRGDATLLEDQAETLEENATTNDQTADKPQPNENKAG